VFLPEFTLTYSLNTQRGWHTSKKERERERENDNKK